MGKKTLYFDSFCGMESYAAVEDGKLTEFNYESQSRVNIIGNIYKGKVTDVLNGMQAAFVNCGLKLVSRKHGALRGIERQHNFTSRFVNASTVAVNGNHHRAVAARLLRGAADY